jgi:hypothetical protein
MAKVIVYQEDDKFSVVCGLGIICERVTRSQAKAAILETLDVSPLESEAWLDNPVSAADYRSVWAAAIGNSIVAGSEQRQQIVGLLTTLTVQLHAILHRFEEADTREAVASLQAKVLRLVDRLKADMAARGIDNLSDEQIIQFLLQDGEPTAVALQELMGVSHD